jgi:hypothetical protein
MLKLRKKWQINLIVTAEVIFFISLILCAIQLLVGINYLLGGNASMSPAFPYPGDRVTITLDQDIVGKDLFEQEFEVQTVQGPALGMRSWAESINKKRGKVNDYKATTSPAEVTIQLTRDTGLLQASGLNNKVILSLRQKDSYFGKESFEVQIPVKVFERISFKKELSTVLVLLSKLPLVILGIIVFYIMCLMFK